jgi:hypothetical protein
MPQRKYTQTSKPKDYEPTAVQPWSRYAPSQQSTRRYDTVDLIAITGKALARQRAENTEADDVQGNTKEDDCYALLRMRPLSISWAECCDVISCGNVDNDKSG